MGKRKGHEHQAKHPQGYGRRTESESLTLSVLDVRKSNVTATIYTVGVGQGMQRPMDEHDRLFPDNHIDIRKWRNESHDRWLIIDDSLYHCGHSLNANGGHKISAITLMAPPQK